jgi:hypothetical protein
MECGGNDGNDAALVGIEGPLQREVDLRYEVKAPSSLALCRRTPKWLSAFERATFWEGQLPAGADPSVLREPSQHKRKELTRNHE